MKYILGTSEKYTLLRPDGYEIVELTDISTKIESKIDSSLTYTKTEIDNLFLNYQETDPVFMESVAFDITTLDVSSWNHKQDLLVSGTNIKTLNNETLLGNGNISVVTIEYLQQNYVHKPDVIYQYETGMSQIYGQKAASITNNWDLTNLDLSPYKYIKVFIKGSNGNDSDSGLTSPIIVTIPLDSSIISGGATFYSGVGITAGVNNHNRMWISFCAVDSTKTKFQLVRTISLYGTAGTDASDLGRFLYRIEGWYDSEEAETGGSAPFNELDPTVPTYVKQITESDISTWNNKQDTLTFDTVPTLNSSNPVTSHGIKTELNKKIEIINLEEYCPTLLQELMVGVLTGSPVALTQTALNEYNSLENITGLFCIAPTLFGPTLLQVGYFNDEDDPQSSGHTYYSRTYFSVLPILGHYGTKNLSNTLSLYKPLIYIQHSFYYGENTTTINNDYMLIMESQYLQEKLGFDNYPILNSDNMLTSGSIYSALQLKQNNLVSGTNIKTINNESLLGTGNMELTKIYNVSSNIYSDNAAEKRAACEELYDAINNGYICKYLDRFAIRQYAVSESGSKTIKIDLHSSYSETPGYIVGYGIFAYYDLSEDTWWVRDEGKSTGIYNICESFLRISGSVDNNTGIISGSIYYDTIGPYSVNKIILHLNNSTGITSNSVLQITATLNNTTYEGPIYVMQNGQYVKLSADMFTGQIDIPLFWSAATASSTTGTWYSFMSFDSNITTLLSYITGGNYNSTNKKIYLTHDSSVISEIDATAFIKDGMINDVSIINSSMVITFNTDAGHEDITLNMHQIFDPSIYYTKNEIDTNFVVNASIQNLNKVPYVSETPAANVTIEPYKMYDFGTVSTTMNIAFDTTKEVSGYTKEYIIRLTAETGCSVVLPNTVLYANRNIPNYTAGHIYEITIVNNCAVVAEFY